MDLVSVIIPVYNGARFIAQAIESVQNQNHTNLEIIIVDDGSTDNTKEIVTSFGTVQYLYQNNKGVASARNLAIQKAKGDYITFLDSDDLLLENKISLQLICLQQNLTIDVCMCHQENFIQEEYAHLKDEHEHFLNYEKISLMTMFVRRGVFEKVGLFNVEYKHSSDFEWITRAKDLSCKVEIIPDILQKRRLHDKNISVKALKDNDVLRFKILKESLQRRRNKSI